MYFPTKFSSTEAFNDSLHLLSIQMMYLTGSKNTINKTSFHFFQRFLDGVIWLAIEKAQTFIYLTKPHGKFNIKQKKKNKWRTNLGSNLGSSTYLVCVKTV